MSMSFEAMEFFDSLYIGLNDIFISICGNHSLKLFRKIISMNKNFICNLLHLNFFGKNTSLSVFFCMADNHHDDSSFHICVYDSLVSFHIFFRIERLVFIRYILPFLNFFHINNSLILLKINKVDIFLCGKAEGMDEDKMGLFFFRKFGRMNELKHLFRIMDLKTFHNSNSISASVSYIKIYIGGKSN